MSEVVRATSAGLARSVSLALALAPACSGAPYTETAAASETQGTSEGAREPAALVRADAWAPLAAADDPLASHRPPTVSCPADAAQVEGGGFEIRTELCNYGAFVQPSLAEVRTGDSLVISGFHADLASPEDATAHMAVLLGGALLWETSIEIPAAPGAVSAAPFDITVTATADAATGTDVVLHVHNHGANSWTLYKVDVIPASD